MKLRFQLLPCTVAIEVDDDRLFPRLQYLANSAAQHMLPVRELEYHVGGRGPYEIREDGASIDQGLTPDDVVAVLYRRSHQQALELLARNGWAVIHGGLVRVEGQRLLLTGSTGVGKTTLVMRLLYEGHQVEGDELALVRDDAVVALPRRFRLKSGIETVVPELGPVIDGLPSMQNQHGRIAAFDPAEAGFRWDIAPGPVDAAVYVTPNHAGRSSLSELKPGELVYRLLSQTIAIDGTSKSRLVTACSGLAKRKGFELTLGDAAEAGAQLATLGKPCDDGANHSTTRTGPFPSMTASYDRSDPIPVGSVWM